MSTLQKISWGYAIVLLAAASLNYIPGLFWFGLLYFADGLMGLMFGSGYLDFGIITYGVVDLPLKIKVLGNLPHLLLGGFAVLASRVWSQPSSKHE